MNDKFIDLMIQGYGQPENFTVTKLNYSSTINHTYKVTLNCDYHGNDDLQSYDLNGRPVSIIISDNGQKRYINGIILHVDQENSYQSDSNSFVTHKVKIEIGPELEMAKAVKTFQVFPPGDLQLYAVKLFTKYKTLNKLPGRNNFIHREFCIQYNESDFNFINRLMESESVFYYYTHSPQFSTLKMGNSISDYEESQICFGGGKGEYKLKSYKKSSKLAVGNSTYNDFDFNAPNKSLFAAKNNSINKNVYKNPVASDYVYPMNVRTFQISDMKTSETGEEFAVNKFEAEQANTEVIEITTEQVWWDIDVGRIFKIAGCSHDFLPVSYSLQINNNQNSDSTNNNIRVNIKAINANTVYRPLMRTPVPHIPNQTATVVGMEPGSISCKSVEGSDKNILVKVKFHWDIDPAHTPLSSDCSCWIRAVQPWAGNGRGFVFIPRVGDEVTVMFESGHPDIPIITGSAYNGKNKLPYSLQEKKHISSIVSRTVPDGKESSSIMFKDDLGMEEFDTYTVGMRNEVVQKNINIKANGTLNLEASAISLNAYDPESGKFAFLTLTPELISVMGEMVNENTDGTPATLNVGELNNKVKPGKLFGGGAGAAAQAQPSEQQKEMAKKAAKKAAKEEIKNEKAKIKAAKKSAELAQKGAKQGVEAAKSGDVSKVTVGQDAANAAAEMGAERVSGA